MPLALKLDLDGLELRNPNQHPEVTEIRGSVSERRPK